MIAGSWIAVGLAIAVLALVVAPLVRAGRSGRHPPPEESLSAARDLQAQQDMLVTSLRDLEDDHATEKIDDGDYAELHARLSAEAIEVMRLLDADRQRRAAEIASRTVRYPGPRGTGS